MPPLQSQQQQQTDIVSSNLISSQQQQPATLEQNLERLFALSPVETKDDYEEVSPFCLCFFFVLSFYNHFCRKCAAIISSYRTRYKANRNIRYTKS